MNAQDMLDHAFGLLDGPRLAQCERAMASDPNLLRRATLIHERVAGLVDDGEEIEAPAGLADRTAALVERRRRKPALLDYMPARVPFRWADVAVAATVFFAALGTLAGPLMRSRASIAQTACAFNLGKLGMRLSNYAATHGSYPFVPISYPAGSYGVMLQDASELPDASILSCPCMTKDGASQALPHMDDFRKAPESSRAKLRDHYAYNIGYRPHPQAEARPVPVAADSFRPIAADGPPHDGADIHEGNSPNHGGSGQNVLFCDGHVSWKRMRWMSALDKDLFRNEADRPAPGLHPADSVLVPGGMPVPAN